MLVLEGDGPNNQHNYVNPARKKLIIKLIDFISVFYPHSQINPPQNDGITLPPQSPNVKSPRLLSLLCRARILLVGCCVLSLIFWPPNSTTYYFLSSIFVD